MKNDPIAEAYIEMLSEMPQLVVSDTPEKIAELAKGLRDHIKANHSKSVPFGDHYHHLKMPNSDLYYRRDGNISKEMSLISKNIQSGVEKGPGGDSKHIHNFMLHHLKNNGSIESSNSNTDGSKKLWVNFIKNNPNLKHRVVNKTENTSVNLTANNIDAHADKIWGHDPEFANSRIITTK